MVGRRYERGEKVLPNRLDSTEGYKAHGRRRKAEVLGKRWGKMMAGLAAVSGIWWDQAIEKMQIPSIPSSILCIHLKPFPPHVSQERTACVQEGDGGRQASKDPSAIWDNMIGFHNQKVRPL